MRAPWPAPSFFRRRGLMSAALAFVAGVWVSSYVPYLSYLWSVPAVLLVVAVLLRRVRWMAFALAALGMFSLGALRGGMELAVPSLPEMGTWQAEGTVTGIVTQNDRAVMFTLADVRVINAEGTLESIDSNLYCYYPTTSASRLEHGQRVAVRGTAYLPNAARNPGGFDQKMWMAQSGSHARMYLNRAPAIIDYAGFSIRGFAIRANEVLCAATDRLFGPVSPVIRAILWGDQTDVPDVWYSWFRDSGIVHLLSVSGLHVGLWFVLLGGLLAPFPLSPRVRWWILMVLLSAYALLTGLRASTIRAVLMLLMVQGSRIAGRKYDPLTGLSMAAALILMARPLDLFGASFQLSFMAVLGLVLLQRPLARALRARSKGVVELFTVSAGAQAATLPMCARWYGNVSLVALVLNLFAVPLAGLLVPCAAVGLLLSAVWGPLGYLPVMAARGMVAALLALSKLASAASFATVSVGAFSPWMLAAYIGCMFLCSTAVVWKWRIRLPAMAVLVAGAVAVGALNGDFLPRYVQLDVGQALSGVLHVGGKTYVYDCGDANSDLTEYLIYTGSRVDALFLSHPHADHVRGMQEMFDAGLLTGQVYVPENATAFGADSGYEELVMLAAQRGDGTIALSQGDVLEIPGGQIEVIAPTAEVTRGSDPNDRSLVLLVTIGEHSLLLMGDADGAAEPLGVDCDVLQVAHHGSKNAARAAFLKDATPDIALLSYGKNSYGHPAQETVERLTDAGATIYATQESGAITVYFGSTIRVEEFLH